MLILIDNNSVGQHAKKDPLLHFYICCELTEKTINLEKFDIAAEPISQYQTKS